MSALRGMVTVARVVRSVVEAAKHVMLDVTAHRDDRTPYLQPYGLQSAPLEGASAVQVAVGGDAGSLVTILVHDRRYTIALAAGEVALIDDLGQKVHLTRTGIVIDADAIKLGGSASLGVARATDPVGPNASLTTWMTAVSGYINGVVPGTVTPALPTGLGTITTGSSVTRSE